MSKAKFARVDLSGAKIGSFLQMDEAAISETSSLQSMEVGSSVSMHKSTFAKIDFTGAKIGAYLIMTDSIFTSGLILNSAEVGRILNMTDSSVLSPLEMSGLQVGSSLLMRRTEVLTPTETPMSIIRETDEIGIDLRLAMIQHNLDFQDTLLPSTLNLTGAWVKGELKFSQSDSLPRWQKGAMLILRNTKVGVLRASIESWPDNLILDGFIYTSFGGSSKNGSGEITDQSVSWYLRWLEKATFSQQAYEYLAEVLRRAGQISKARTILYASKERERSELCHHTHPTDLNSCELLYFPWLWLTLVNLFIGHGYRMYYALFWAVGTVMVGMGVLYVSKQAQKYDLKYAGLAYSFDMFLPIIELRKYHYDKIDLDGWVRVYFYVHKLFGYILVFFLIAGLSGLTK